MKLDLRRPLTLLSQRLLGYLCLAMYLNSVTWLPFYFHCPEKGFCDRAICLIKKEHTKTYGRNRRPSIELKSCNGSHIACLELRRDLWDSWSCGSCEFCSSRKHDERRWRWWNVKSLKLSKRCFRVNISMRKCRSTHHRCMRFRYAIRMSSVGINIPSNNCNQSIQFVEKSFDWLQL